MCAAAQILSPGALMSTQLPKFEYQDLVSKDDIAPTVIALDALAGETPQASNGVPQ